MALPINVLREEQRARFEKFDIGDILLPWALRPCRLKILMVTDNDFGFVAGSFSNSYFGLSALLDALRVQPDFFVRYDVTKAHRQTDLYKPK